MGICFYRTISCWQILDFGILADQKLTYPIHPKSLTHAHMTSCGIHPNAGQDLLQHCEPACNRRNKELEVSTRPGFSMWVVALTLWEWECWQIVERDQQNRKQRVWRKGSSRKQLIVRTASRIRRFQPDGSSGWWWPDVYDWGSEGGLEVGWIFHRADMTAAWAERVRFQTLTAIGDWAKEEAWCVVIRSGDNGPG